MILRILQVAELEAAIWYETQRQQLGDEFLVELDAAIKRIHNEPGSFAALESYSGPGDVRRCLLKRFPYVVVFLNRPEEVLVVAISHVRRRPFYWLERLD